MGLRRILRHSGSRHRDNLTKWLDFDVQGAFYEDLHGAWPVPGRVAKGAPVAKPTPLVVAGVPTTMSSREIAELTGKLHAHVMRDIRVMLGELDPSGATQSKFGSSYKDSTGRTLAMFNLPKDLTITLVAGYSIPLRHRIVVRWQELETQAAKPPAPVAPALPDFTNPPAAPCVDGYGIFRFPSGASFGLSFRWPSGASGASCASVRGVAQVNRKGAGGWVFCLLQPCDRYTQPCEQPLTYGMLGWPEGFLLALAQVISRGHQQCSSSAGRAVHRYAGDHRDTSPLVMHLRVYLKASCWPLLRSSHEGISSVHLQVLSQRVID